MFGHKSRNICVFVLFYIRQLGSMYLFWTMIKVVDLNFYEEIEIFI